MNSKASPRSDKCKYSQPMKELSARACPISNQCHFEGNWTDRLDPRLLTASPQMSRRVYKQGHKCSSENANATSQDSYPGLIGSIDANLRISP